MPLASAPIPAPLDAAKCYWAAHMFNQVGFRKAWVRSRARDLTTNTSILT